MKRDWTESGYRTRERTHSEKTLEKSHCLKYLLTAGALPKPQWRNGARKCHRRLACRISNRCVLVSRATMADITAGCFIDSFLPCSSFPKYSSISLRLRRRVYSYSLKWPQPKPYNSLFFHTLADGCRIVATVISICLNCWANSFYFLLSYISFWPSSSFSDS